MAEKKSNREYFMLGIKSLVGSKPAAQATSAPPPAAPAHPVGGGAVPKRNAAIQEAAEDTTPAKPMGVKGAYAPRGN